MIAVGWAIALRIGFNIPWPARADHPRRTLIALGFWLVTPLPILASASVLFCARLFHFDTGLVLLLVLFGAFLEDRRNVGELFAFVAQPNDRDWLNRFLVHWACFWICVLEGLFFLLRGSLSGLAVLFAFCLLALPLSLRLLCAHAVGRELLQGRST